MFSSDKPPNDENEEVLERFLKKPQETENKVVAEEAPVEKAQETKSKKEMKIEAKSESLPEATTD